MLRSSIRRAAFVHVTSGKEVESIHTQFPAAKTEVLPHGTSVDDPTGGQFRERFSELANREYVLCLSRIHPIKRLDLAIKAFASLALEFPNTQMVIAGNDSGALDELKTLVDELGLQDRCIFTGFVAGADKARAYADARVLLHTSDHENFGLSVVEAMAYGCPVVTTVGVASGVYVGEASAGVVVPSDVTEIATALRMILNTPREEPGQRGAAFVEQNLTWPRIANRLTGLYETAITNRTTPV